MNQRPTGVKEDGFDVFETDTWLRSCWFNWRTPAGIVARTNIDRQSLHRPKEQDLVTTRLESRRSRARARIVEGISVDYRERRACRKCLQRRRAPVHAAIDLR